MYWVVHGSLRIEGDVSSITAARGVLWTFAGGAVRIGNFLVLIFISSLSLFGQSAPVMQSDSPATREIREEFYAVTNQIRKAADAMPGGLWFQARD